MSHSSLGWVAVVVATIGYGSLFVPVKNYEVYDGLVYQWFQCCGVLLCGIIFACCLNDWDASGMSAPGFYVCREGILSGVTFQVANVLATQSVKLFGMGNYFTTHEVTNLGGAFFFGVFGKSMGIPSTPPSKPALALLGFVFVLLGTIPLALTETEGVADDDQVTKPTLGERASSWHGRTPENANEEEKPQVSRGFLGSISNALGVGSSGLGRALNSSGTSSAQMRGYGRCGTAMLIVQENDSPEIGEHEHRLENDVRETKSAPLLLAKTGGTDDQKTWFAGLTVSLLAGLVFSLMYIPLLPWSKRMHDQKVNSSSFDYFFSISVGLFLASSFYMLIGGAWKKYQGHKMQKSVLRPAMMTGAMWAVSSMANLYAMTALPFAVAYCLVCGGGLAVSLLWGVLVFNEASTPHNVRCTVASFAFVLVGMIAVALAK